MYTARAGIPSRGDLPRIAMIKMGFKLARQPCVGESLSPLLIAVAHFLIGYIHIYLQNEVGFLLLAEKGICAIVGFCFMV